MNSSRLLEIIIDSGIGNNKINLTGVYIGIAIYFGVFFSLLYLVIDSFNNNDAISLEKDWYLIALPIFWPIVLIGIIIYSICKSITYLTKQLFYEIATIIKMIKLRKQFREQFAEDN